MWHISLNLGVLVFVHVVWYKRANLPTKIPSFLPSFLPFCFLQACLVICSVLFYFLFFFFRAEHAVCTQSRTKLPLTSFSLRCNLVRLRPSAIVLIHRRFNLNGRILTWISVRTKREKVKKCVFSWSKPWASMSSYHGRDSFSFFRVHRMQSKGAYVMSLQSK